jgi:hypothetical protein
MDVWHWHFSQKKKTDEKRYWYFDRSAWNQYIRDQLGASVLIPDDGAAPDALKHYIILLGLMGLNRYGWISLEGTWWSPQRAAIVTLVNHRELNVIRMLLRAPNIEGRAYAVDALMYLEYLGHPMTTEDRRIIDKMHEDNEQIKAESLMGEDPPRVLRFNEIFTERYTDILPIWYKTINERIAYYESVYLFP